MSLTSTKGTVILENNLLRPAAPRGPEGETRDGPDHWQPRAQHVSQGGPRAQLAREELLPAVGLAHSHAVVARDVALFRFVFTLYLFLHPGTGQAKGFSSPPFMHMEPRMASELMALSVVQDSSLSDSS